MYAEIANQFGKLGGFDAILSRMSASTTLLKLDALVGAIVPVVHFLAGDASTLALIDKLKSVSFTRLQALNATDLSKEERAQFKTTAATLRDIIGVFVDEAALSW
jgi:hypothetical protein